MAPSSCCHIFAAGPFYGLPARPAPGDYVIAADGGYRWCLQEAIVPQLLLGDFDSLPQAPKGICTHCVPPEKDDTDTMLAIKAGLHLGYREFHLYGALGGRLDHTLANLQSLVYLAEHGARGVLYGEGERYTAIRNGSICLPAQNAGIFSVFCFGPDAKGVSIRGAQFSLSDATLTAGFPLGVSNHFIGATVTLSVENGCLVIGWDLSDH